MCGRSSPAGPWMLFNKSHAHMCQRNAEEGQELEEISSCLLLCFNYDRIAAL